MSGDQPKRHPKDQVVIDRFFANQPACHVCNETTWRVGDTVVSPVVGSTGKPDVLRGPFRVTLHIVCSTCNHVLLFDTGDVPEWDTY